MRSTLTLSAVLVSVFLLSGCAAVTVAGTAVGLAATAAGVVVDTAVGTAKVVGGAVMPSRSEDK